MKKNPSKKSFLLSPSCFQRELSSSPTCLKEGRKIIIENPSPALPEERKERQFSEKSYFPSLTFNRGQLGKEKKNSTTVETRIFLLQQGGGEP